MPGMRVDDGERGGRSRNARVEKGEAPRHLPRAVPNPSSHLRWSRVRGGVSSTTRKRASSSGFARWDADACDLFLQLMVNQKADPPQSAFRPYLPPSPRQVAANHEPSPVPLFPGSGTSAGQTLDVARALRGNSDARVSNRQAETWAAGSSSVEIRSVTSRRGEFDASQQIREDLPTRPASTRKWSVTFGSRSRQIKTSAGGARIISSAPPRLPEIAVKVFKSELSGFV